MPRLLLCFPLCLAAVYAQAHCNPIGVQVHSGRLRATLGTLDPVGFAPQIFLNPDEDCGFEQAPNDRWITDVPGFDIANMAPDSGLFLEPIGRTASGVGPPEKRWFWFWDPATQAIQLAPHITPLRVRSVQGFGTIELPQSELPLPGSLKVAHPRTGDIGVHTHPVRYELTGVTQPISGAYGFFARLTSPTYAPSEPFLVMLNMDLSPAQLAQAAWAINRDAGSGDFDANGEFNCADIDELVVQVASGNHSPRFDLNGDGLVNLLDVDTWRARAGAAQLPTGLPYLPGDANLDGVVDGQDFGRWNAHKSTAVAAWCRGDFTANGVVDLHDFAIWTAHKFQSSLGTGLVPEPAGLARIVFVLSACLSRIRSRLE